MGPDVWWSAADQGLEEESWLRKIRNPIKAKIHPKEERKRFKAVVDLVLDNQQQSRKSLDRKREAQVSKGRWPQKEVIRPKTLQILEKFLKS